MISCRRPSNRSSRLTRPSGPSNAYSFSTAILGIRRRLAASASWAWVSAFSSTSSSSRAAFHSCGETVGGMFMVIWLLAFWSFRGGNRPSDSRDTARARNPSLGAGLRPVAGGATAGRRYCRVTAGLDWRPGRWLRAGSFPGCDAVGDSGGASSGGPGLRRSGSDRAYVRIAVAAGGRALSPRRGRSARGSSTISSVFMALLSGGTVFFTGRLRGGLLSGQFSLGTLP